MTAPTHRSSVVPLDDKPIQGLKADNPFTKQSQAEQADRFFSTAQERAAVAPQLAQMREQGYVVLPHAITAEQAEEVAEEIRRLNEDTPWGRGAFDGYRTRRVFNMLAKTRVVDALALHPQVVALAESFLEDQIQFSQALGITIYPGQEAQALHRDDDYFPLPRPRPPMIMNALWAITDFTAETGATHIVPRTHLSTDAEPPPGQELRAEMPTGSVVLYDGAMFHGGGANQSAAPRIGLTMLYSRAWLRQQENHFLSVPREVVREMPRRLQQLLGYWVYNNLLGLVEGRSPMRVLDQQP